MKRNEIITLILCLIIGFGLRFYTFDQKSLWTDEIHTYNESRDDLRDQFKYYEKEPTHLHPPLFFILTHFFYPFQKPERDLRILPLIFGILSIPTFYLLARLFSPSIGLPCALSLAFMTYHIGLSQEGRSYTLALFFALLSLYFFMLHLRSTRKIYLIPVALLFALLFYTSYTSLLFVALCQILWFYPIHEDDRKFPLAPFLLLNSLFLVFILPWILFLLLHYKHQPFMPPFEQPVVVSFWEILYGLFHDWVPFLPLMTVSAILFILLPFYSRNGRQSAVLLGSWVIPLGAAYLLSKLIGVSHFITSRYFISFLPLFFITLYLSIQGLEAKYNLSKRFLRPDLLFVLLFILSNLVLLPIYYRSEKQDFRGLVNYLKQNLRPGDNIYDATISMGRHVGIFHYFGILPADRHYHFDYRKTEEGMEFKKTFIYKGHRFTIYHSDPFDVQQFVQNGARLWMIVGDKGIAADLQKHYPCILKGYFDGSVVNFQRFPMDASMYLFLWDPKSPNEKGIDLQIQ